MFLAPSIFSIEGLVRAIAPQRFVAAPQRFVAAPQRFLLTLMVVTGCSSTPYVWAKDVPAQRAMPAIESGVLGRGDVVSVSVVGQETMSGVQTVGADGTIVFPNVGPVPLLGLTVAQASFAIEAQLSKILKAPNVSVVVITRLLEVSILGEIENPGKYQIQSGDGIANALAMAGGLTEFANYSAIYLIRAGEPLRVRFRMRDLLRGGNSARSFALWDGDILVVE